MKLIPLLSLTILLISYSIWGWSLAEANASNLLYFFVTVTIFLLDFILTFSLPHYKGIVKLWFQSDISTFLAVITMAFLFVVIIKWIHISVNALVLISAGILVRLDTQIYGFKKWQSFGILLIISEVSLAIGTALYILLNNQK